MREHVQTITRGLFKTVSVAVMGVLFFFILLLALFFNNLVKSLPEVTTLRQYHHEVGTEVFSDEGRKIGEFTEERRYAVKFETIPQHVIKAFLAAEDAQFYQHGGVDMRGIGRAIVSNLLKGRYAQGGSTITQQVARNVLLMTRKKDITRKIREILLAWRMEKELTKNEILGLYLSDINMGHGAYGLGAASRNYFNKNPQDLTLAEASLLAGLPQLPNKWDPFRNPHLSRQRQSYVLNRMVEEKFITVEEAKAAKAEPLKLYALQDFNATESPYFTEYVRQYLMKKYGSSDVLKKGYQVYTTVRYDYQKAAEKELERGLREVDKRLGWRGTKSHVTTNEELAQVLGQIHDEVTSRVTRVRLLAPQVPEGTKKLPYDTTAYQGPNSPYYGDTPLMEGEIYRSVITEVNDKGGIAIAYVGKTPVILPIAMMEWITIDQKPLKTISQILKAGDVVQVRVQKSDRKERRILASLEQEPEIQGAVLTYDVESGWVRAMVGGRDFEKSKFNRALQAKRQVGSTFKPLIYAAAIDKGFSPSSIVTDSPLVFKFEGKLDADSQGEDWRPHNYSGKFEGDIPLRLALVRSMNIPTVKILNEISLDYAIEYARTLGITAVLPRDLSIALGSWSCSLEEIMRAYAIFPRLGKPVQLNYIKKVVDEEGKIVEEMVATRAPAAKVQLPPAADPDLQAAGLVISPQTAYVITDMLKAVVREGTGRAAFSVPASVAGKTGTSNDHRDAWFVGYTPQIMSGVWVGFDENKPLDPGETGGRAAAPIWSAYMQEVMKNTPRVEFSIPDDIVFAHIDRDTGKLAAASNPRRVRVAFKVGSVPAKDGSGLPRIGEPGIRATSTTSPENPPSSEESVPKQEESSEFLREGYQ